MNAISLFSGAGGMDVGFHAAGIKTVLACEQNKTAAETLKLNFEFEVFAGDVNDLIPTLKEGQAEIIFGGPPCQGYSVAGKMNPEDPRSSLVFAFLRAVERVKPAVFVMENVDALARLAKWQPVLDQIKQASESIGYSVHVAILNSSDYGIPQSRGRMFMWGSRNHSSEEIANLTGKVTRQHIRPMTPSRKVFERLGPSGTTINPHTCPAKISFCKNPVLRASAYAGMLFNGAGRPIDPDRPAPTMSASAGGNKTHIVDEGHIFHGNPSFAETYRRHLISGKPYDNLAPSSLRRLTIKESMAFQTFPEDYKFAGKNSALYRQIGNAVPCELAKIVARAAMAIF